MFSTFSQTEMTQISLPSRTLKLVKSLPFQTLEVWKRYHFRVELPLLSYCRRYPRDLCLLFSTWEKQSLFLEAISMLQNWLFSWVECLGNGVRGWWLVLFSFFILDLDECEDKTHQCDVNANCTNIPGSYNCTYRPGYTGNGSICNGIINYPSLHFISLQVI